MRCQKEYSRKSSKTAAKRNNLFMSIGFFFYNKYIFSIFYEMKRRRCFQFVHVIIRTIWRELRGQSQMTHPPSQTFYAIDNFYGF